ncbi:MULTISPECIES: glycerophosphoryl diester phosphodiesterase membrane domain-containing protein [Bacillus cereus group]|uniref:glycerophosphoryl diester phosphodiesterase membrane domain-containing protein n=1 Tax=Bacillus cereus group TaxID=86661 RepID=UPI0003122D81|nr:glycerophosphoryl diester phosphodiesterase membrane domain-containing protein [Bacillus toyonensis]OTW91298.1 glycerophosphodiester phosphodiesterase [Bacillus thuringiensis serovar cameroun]OTX01962.1 glycerophosphodiester phosphodiesterase [Bacillus thuringiensis serovar seoulensis]QPW50352.1 glycerophosphodiester phosphodiesterase [Bacillus thuringiensis]MCA1047388.1 glycerophosphodiester phosphodiesterase [Bacillus toyonensis]MDO8158867.1 glycerophosphodiester phosphodiesterase [Bacill
MQHRKRLSIPGVMSHSFQTVKFAFWNVLTFQLAYKLLAAIVFVPLFGIIFNKLLYFGGYANATNDELLVFLKTPYGILAIVILSLLALFLIFTEFAVLIIISYFAHKRQKVKLRPILYKTVTYLPTLFTYCLPGFILYAVVLLPLLNMGYETALIPQIQIPNFITGELFKTTMGQVGYYTFFAVVAYLNLRWIFVLPIVVLEQKPFRTAARKSATLVKESFFKVLFFLVGFFISIGIVYIVFFGIYLLCLWGVYEFTNPEGTFALLAESTISVFLTSTLYLFSFIVTPFYIMAITRLYLQKVPVEDVLLEEGLDYSKTKADKCFFQKHRWKFISVYIVGIITAGMVVAFIVTFISNSYKEPIIMAHRGYISKGVENTKEAVQGAIDAKADYAEIDVLQTKDGELAVIHDLKLKRLANANVHVSDLTMDELRQLTLSQDGFSGQISTLDEIIKLAKGKIKLNIEVKLHGGEKDFVNKVLKAIKDNEFEKQCVIQTLHYPLIKEFKRANSDIKVGYILYASRANLKNVKADFYVAEEYMLNKKLVKEARKLNKPIYVWTVNDMESLKAYYKLNVDGIITDYPEDARETIKELKEQEAEESDLFDKITETTDDLFSKLFISYPAAG